MCPNLYKAKYECEVCFLYRNTDNIYDLVSASQAAVEQEIDDNGTSLNGCIEVQKIENEDEIPSGWKGALPRIVSNTAINVKGETCLQVVKGNDCTK